MLLLRRPPEPTDFTARARDAHQRVEAAVLAEERPTFEPPLWADYKPAFIAAQHHKCAYCEMFTTGVSIGHVDHVRPKAAVAVLEEDPETWGREERGGNVKGRRAREVCNRGYWWLAYRWTNLCFACERCNTGWKRSLFPVSDVPRQLPPDPEVEETVLLLDPYGDERPSRHLRFDELGQVQAKPESVHGFETVRTLGLDRESLRHSREEKARKTFHILARLEGASSPSVIRECIDDLIQLGNERFVHAGMVRIIVEQWLDVSWDELTAAHP